MKKILLLAWVLAWPSSATAGFVTGFNLSKWGDAQDRIIGGRGTAVDYQDAANLYGYVTGVHDALDGVAFCSPGTARAGQLMAVVHNYVKQHPERWDEGANYLVVTALKEAFPCKK
ncbi:MULTISPECIES: Rap1a/Tai family immunity protein [Duganella]|uniref:Rap1a immunity protein domain-containing protein n=2 Tax=Duganella TaxID=75654 RepID=A0A7X4GZM3_9BURK|nr:MULTISPECIES: Rap1a/Tai family immunity protein [Duganella]MYM72140.1 hypothetical protein [Duganella margarita]MYN30332.1 hypothetical protein [Duganella levis]